MPKHSLPPQEQILTYGGRFTKCPYETVQKSRHSIKERMDELAELEDMRRIVNAIPTEIVEAYTQRNAAPARGTTEHTR